MKFTLLASVDARCPRKSCGWTVLGKGDVLEASPADFVSFLAQQKRYKFQTVILQSYGGDFGAGLQLGLLFRWHHLNTLVLKDGGCWSACAYAFLGGVRRTVRAGGRYGLHTGDMVMTDSEGYPLSKKGGFSGMALSNALNDGYMDGVGDAGLLMRYAEAMGIKQGFLAATLHSYGDTYDLTRPCMAWLHITTNQKVPSRNPCPGIKGVRAWLCRPTPGLSQVEVAALLDGKRDKDKCTGKNEGWGYRFF